MHQYKVALLEDNKKQLEKLESYLTKITNVELVLVSTSTDDFFERLKEVAPEKVEKYQLKNAWNAMLLSYRKESLEFLNELSRQYNLYLLSNTNEIHYAAFSEMLRRETKFDNLESFFTKAFYSHELKMRKPDKEIYEYELQSSRCT